MKKEFKVEGMSCNHCRTSVEKALNSIDDVTASVTLDPPVVIIEFNGNEVPLETLQKALDEVGDFKITAL